MLGQLQEGNNSCAAMLEHRSETRGGQPDSITKVSLWKLTKMWKFDHS